MRFILSGDYVKSAEVSPEKNRNVR